MSPQRASTEIRPTSLPADRPRVGIDRTSEFEADLLRRARAAFEKTAVRAAPYSGGSQHVGVDRRLREEGDHGTDEERDELLDWLSIEAGPSGTEVLTERSGSVQVPAIESAPRVSEILADSLDRADNPMGVFAWPDGAVMWANGAFADCTGLHVEPRALMELLDEWSQAHFLVRALPKLLREGRWEGWLSLMDPAGGSSPMTATLIAHRHVSDRIDAMTFIARDDSSAAEDASAAEDGSLRGSRQWASAAAYSEALDSGPLAALMEHISDLLLVMDPGGQVTFASPAASESLGILLDERGDPTGWLLDILHPEDRPGGLHLLVGGPKRLRFRSASGQWQQLDTTVTDLRANSKVRGFVLTARAVGGDAVGGDDVADLREVEGEDQSVQRVRHLDRQLRRALDRDWLAIH